MSWTGFCAGVGVLFFLRGLVLVGFSPPFEGFDEPVHTAYFVYLNEVGTRPVLGKAIVPQSMYEDLVAYPHPKASMGAIGKLGGYSYVDFYENEPRLISRDPIPLYQAQHPPLYYVCLSGLFAAVHSRFGLVAAIGILRMVNLVFAAAAVALFVFPLDRILRDPAAARLGALAVGLFPMMLVYVARVGNDAPAMMFFAVAFVVLAGIEDETRLFVRAAAAGLLIGAGTLTKLIAFLLLPAGAVYLIWLAILRIIRWRNAAAALALLLTGYLAVCLPNHLANLRQYGTPFSEAGTVINKMAGVGLVDVLADIRPSHLWDFFLLCLVKSNLWISGWSLQPPHPLLEWTWVGLLAICVSGAVPLAQRIRHGKAKLSEPALHAAVFCILVVGAVFAGTYAQALKNLSAWGVFAAPQYYTMAAYPALFTVAFVLLAAYERRRLFFAVAGGFVCLFVVTEASSLTFRAIPHWANSAEPAEVFRRLTALHGVIPSPAVAIVAGAAAAMVLVVLLREVQVGSLSDRVGQGAP